MPKVLFVCLGNICRSPLAEAIFNYKTLKLKYESDSAGTAAYHVGSDPDHRSIATAESRGIPIEHKARQFDFSDFDLFDYIIAMDEHNYKHIKEMSVSRSDQIYLMREFDDLGKNDKNVPDPYYGGQDGFELVYEILDRSIDNLIAHIQSEQSA